MPESGLNDSLIEVIFVGQGVLLFGLALMAGGVGALVWIRGELAVQVPVLNAVAGGVRRLALAGRRIVRVVGPPPWPGPVQHRRPAGRPARAVGRAAVPAHTLVQPRVRRDPTTVRAVGRASPPSSSLIRRS